MQFLTTQCFNVQLKLLTGPWVFVYSHVTSVHFSFSSGYVCERKDLLVNGCCNVNAPSSSQYVCKSCLANGCCSVYEYCVSCCLQPDNVLQTAYLYFFVITQMFEFLLKSLSITVNPNKLAKHFYSLSKKSQVLSLLYLCFNFS